MSDDGHKYTFTVPEMPWKKESDMRRLDGQNYVRDLDGRVYPVPQPKAGCLAPMLLGYLIIAFLILEAVIK